MLPPIREERGRKSSLGKERGRAGGCMDGRNRGQGRQRGEKTGLPVIITMEEGRSSQQVEGRNRRWKVVYLYGDWCGCRVPRNAPPALSLCVCGWPPLPPSFVGQCKMQNTSQTRQCPMPPPPCSLLKCPQGPPVHKRTHPAAPSIQQPSSSQPPVSYQTQLAQQ